MLITYPLTQPDQPRWPTFGCFHSTGLQFDAYTSQAAAFPPPNGGNCTTRGSDTPTTRPLKASCSAKPPPPPTSCAALHPRPAQGELLRARTHIRPSRATNIAHRTQKHSDDETNNTTAHPQHGAAETDDTSAPEKRTKNAHFSPAKAIAVSNPHRHKQAKAIAVSNHRATSPATPRRSARGRLLAATPMGGDDTAATQTQTSTTAPP